MTWCLFLWVAPLTEINNYLRWAMINRIHKKKNCVHIICVCTVYIYYVYINTHTCMYIFKKNVMFIKYINYMNINIHVNILKMYTVCVSCIYT